MPGGSRVDILMYHSISENPGPTNIAPQVFADQIAALAASGLPVLAMDQFVKARAASTLPPRSVVVTFDDGFQDFADVAWPILKAQAMPAMNYLPTHYLGGWAEFDPDGGKRAIMTMQTARELANDGADIGCHTVTHPKLTHLATPELRHELDHSKDVLEQGLGRAVDHIAPPFGDVNERVNAEIGKRFTTSVTTELRPASGIDVLNALPRIEMFYFQDMGHWQRYLDGRMGYLRLRKALRTIGKLRHIGR